ncbi:xanthine dehydrogenase family protein molybdopterin-binding subunit [Halotalea alkalilenta]|uniref:xanthine dehydrogenase family protein molybdopterin-binding subunit n=1 Tax=Halotalea alkalilenta TaxID=376489 RepID=UPI000A980B35|nr:molybdopterin cofactor-binding domain-containing protein [Halotalea alkalilenta]
MSAFSTASRNPRVDRARLFDADGVLCVYRNPAAPPVPAPGQPGSRSSYVPCEPEPFVALFDDGRVLAFNGHVDLGTGIRTALAQIVAEELEVDFSRIDMVLGDPDEVPNQGPTIASATIQIAARPLRIAAAQARRALLEFAAERLEAPVETLVTEVGVVMAPDGGWLDYAELLRGRRALLELDESVVPKPASAYRVVGRAMPRVDIPAKVFGETLFVHDLRLPGMLHGRVVRPPYVGRDGGAFIGRSLIEVDRASIDEIEGVVAVVVEGDFVGVVAEREEQAILAAKRLACRWRVPPPLPNLDRALAVTLRDAPSTHRTLKREGDVEAAMAQLDAPLSRTYLWPYQLHASIGPSCAVADWRESSEGTRLALWSGSQNPHSLRADLSRLCGLDESAIAIKRLEASGCYGRNGADDVCADAALLSRAVGRPVRVQLSRSDEHGWEPKGAAQLIEVSGGRLASGALVYDLVIRYPSNDAPTLALLLTGREPAEPRVFEMGDRSAVPPYAIEHLGTACEDMAPIVRSAWLRGVSALPNVFAHESFIDELAYLAGRDPLAFRLDYLIGGRARTLLAELGARAGWQPRRAGPDPARRDEAVGRWVRGRGLAYAHYVHSRFPGFGAAMAAAVVELAVALDSGEVRVERVVLVQDAGQMVNPAGVRHQVHGNLIQALGRTLKERVQFGSLGAESLEWGGYPILDFSELPAFEVHLLERPDEPPLGVGESASLPVAPAIANALFDATGRHFRAPPFTPERVREVLAS